MFLLSILLLSLVAQSLSQCSGGTYNDGNSCENCAVGKYSRDNALECISCQPGKYSSAQGSSSCTKCEAGRYSIGGGDSSCSVCGTGTFSDIGSANCTACVSGQYGSSNGLASCTACASGRFTSSSGATSCLTSCPSGQYANITLRSCISCDAGTYAASSSFICTDCAAGRYSAGAVSSCTACSSGQFSNTTASSKCYICTAGTYASGTGNSGCTSCAGGRYSSGGANSCASCSSGQYSSSASSSCTDCPAGQYTSSSQQSSCLVCNTGLYATASTAATSCSATCPAGTFTDTGLTYCTNCDAGQYSSSGATSCTDCALGRYSGSKSSSCTSCSAGDFGNTTAAIKCYQCEPGKYSSQTGSSTCTSCPAGWYATAGSNFCSTCSSGTYSEAGMGECQDCGPGTTSGGTASSCTACSSGSYSYLTYKSTYCTGSCGAGRFANITSSSCDGCSAGTYSAYGSSTCTDCAAGRYSSSLATSCSTCSSGQFSNISSSACSVCGEGRYASGSGNSQCTTCSAGRYAEGGGDSSCASCSAGQYSEAGAATCTTCSAGYYASGTGNSGCTACAEGSYWGAPGGSSCTTCPSGFVCQEAAKWYYAFYPTPAPTSLPTLLPSIPPTSLPTLSCPNGTVYSNEEGCVACSIGKYSLVTSSNPRPVNCTFCPAGQYNIQTSAKACIECDAGKLSTEDRSTCRDCQAGEYNNNDIECVSCKKGKYAPTAQDGSCLTCFAGDFTNNATGATTCTSCDAGKYSHDLAIECISCSEGSFSGTRASNCTLCASGSYSNRTESDSCVACAAGRYMGQSGAQACLQCSRGQYQPSTGQDFCIDCTAGKFSDEKEALSCTNCDTGYNSGDKAVRCSLADRDFYLKAHSDGRQGNISVECPANMNCAGGQNAPAPDKGFWVDRSKYAYIDDLYKCSRKTCKGSESSNQCWNYKNTSSSSSKQCDQDAVLCTEGSNGPLCGSCIAQYIYKPIQRRCEPCTSNVVASFVLTLVAGMSVFFIAIWVALNVTQAHEDYENTSGLFSKCQLLQSKVSTSMRGSLFFRTISTIGRNFDTGSLKVTWVTLQIIMSCSWNLDIEYPEPFSSFLSWFGFISFDFLSIDCFQSGEARYFSTVYVWSCVPLALMLVIFGIMFARLSYINAYHLSVTFHLTSKSSLKPISFFGGSGNDMNNDVGNEKERLDAEHKLKREQIIAGHINIALLLSYLVLPPVALKHFQSLDCITFPHDGSSYLRVDTGISCESDEYINFRGFVVLFIILYQSIPVVWFVLMFKQRRELNQRHQSDINLALFIRDQDKSLDYLRFLFNDYLPSRWWFEVVEIYRRMLFVGILPLMSSDVSIRALMGVILAIISVAFYREEQPFRVDFTNLIAFVAQYVILLVYYCALSIATGLVVFGLKDAFMGFFLLGVVLIVLALVLLLAYKRMRQEHSLKQSVVNHATRRAEDASSFSKTKFATTFRAIFNTAVPATHVLAFHYTSIESAKAYQKTGIVSESAVDGILVSLKGPHQITSIEKIMFPDSNDFEAVLVLSLPARLLHPVQGVKDKDIRHVPSAVLLAMRPTAFTAVFDHTPWLRLTHMYPNAVSGPCILPPASIVRIYVLRVQSKEDGRTDRSGSRPTLPRISSFLTSSVGEKNVEMVQPRATYKRESTIRNKNIHVGVDLEPTPNLGIVIPSSISEFCISMGKIRNKCSDAKMVPLFHYTQPSVIRYMIQGGFRMSTQGQGDGGVYFSTMSPSSYGLGTKDYEQNLITDCFGPERLEEYLGGGRLNAVIVAACQTLVLQAAPGGRDRAKVVSKSDFLAFSLPHLDGNFFLRPDRILGIFLIDAERQPRIGAKSVSQLMMEKERAQDMHNLSLIRRAHQLQRDVFGEVMERSSALFLQDDILPDDDDDDDDDEGNEEGQNEKAAVVTSGDMDLESCDLMRSYEGDEGGRHSVEISDIDELYGIYRESSEATTKFSENVVFRNMSLTAQHQSSSNQLDQPPIPPVLSAPSRPPPLRPTQGVQPDQARSLVRNRGLSMPTAPLTYAPRSNRAASTANSLPPPPPPPPTLSYNSGTMVEDEDLTQI